MSRKTSRKSRGSKPRQQMTADDFLASLDLSLADCAKLHNVAKTRAANVLAAQKAASATLETLRFKPGAAPAFPKGYRPAPKPYFPDKVSVPQPTPKRVGPDYGPNGYRYAALQSVGLSYSPSRLEQARYSARHFEGIFPIGIVLRTAHAVRDLNGYH